MVKRANYFETFLQCAATNQSYFETFLQRAATNQSYFGTLMQYAATNQSYFEAFLQCAVVNQSKSVKNNINHIKLAELEIANNDFSTAYAKRNEELTTAPNEKLKELRNKANDLYYKLRTRINSNLDINDGAEPWASRVNLLNQNISTYTLLQTRRAAGKGEEPLAG